MKTPLLGGSASVKHLCLLWYTDLDVYSVCSHPSETPPKESILFGLRRVSVFGLRHSRNRSMLNVSGATLWSRPSECRTPGSPKAFLLGMDDNSLRLLNQSEKGGARLATSCWAFKKAGQDVTGAKSSVDYGQFVFYIARVRASSCEFMCFSPTSSPVFSIQGPRITTRTTSPIGSKF